MVCFTMRIVQWIPILLIIIYDITVCVGSGYTQIDCGPEKFRCDNGECIANELLCNGRADCTDSSDETEDECKKSDILCPTSTFRCNYGACINEDYRCNGIQDCIDNSDETYCNRNNKTDQKINFTRRCKHDEYGCSDGQCIHINDKCDGIPNCGDGSDETFTLCGSLFCPPTAFRCAYGACIDGNLRCDGVTNCADNSDEDSKLCEWPSLTSPIRPTINTARLLPIHRRSVVISINNCTVPPQPENGHWKLHPGLCSDEQDCNVPEGTEVGLGSHLIYSCNPGYELKGTTDVICNFQRKWQPDIPICTEIRCEALDTASTRVECKYKYKWISCTSSVPPETNAELSCKNGYQSATNQNILFPQRNNVICNENGQWKPEPMQCVSVCGILPFDVKPLIVGGYRANVTEFPWHATIYLDERGEKRFICGASIIQENLLITAAICVFDQNNRQLYNPRKFYILTGNIFRNYDDPSHNPELVHRNQVKHIYIHSNYLGFEGNFLRDIAILELVTPFVFSATLVPVCIDTLNDRSVLEPNSFGKVAGFGRTESSASSAVLQALTVPVIIPNQCWSASQNAKTQRFFTNDKFCAGYTNGSSVCDGDSGSGLVFETDNLWYLRGIVSISLGTKEEDGNTYCDNNLYTLYTDISRYNSWIATVIREIKLNRTHILCSELSSTRCS